MLRKLFFAPLLLSLASLLSVTGLANAQRHGGGHGGGYHGGGHVAHVGGYRGGHYGGYGGGYYGGSRGYGGGYYGGYRGYGGGYYGGGLLGGLFGFGYPYYGGYSSYWPRSYGGYGYGGYGYSYPSYGYNYAYPSSYSAAPIYYDDGASTVSTVVDQTAHVRVLLPDPQAHVWFDGTATQQTGTDRSFHTPTLPTGVTSQYRVRASWMVGTREVVQERVVSVTPGENVVVDFRNAI